MSYGQNAPSGFQSYGTQTAATFTGQMAQYPIKSAYAESIFTGDPVILEAGFLKPVTDGATVKTLAALPVGVFQGCQRNSPDANVQGLAKSPYWAGGTVVNPWGGVADAGAWVIIDPNAPWNIQVSTSKDEEAATATVKADQIGLYATWGIKQTGDKLVPPNPGKGNTATGQSGVYLDASTINADPKELPLVILGFASSPHNHPGKPFCNVIVGWNPKIVKPA